jgi:crotonobetaine/carnitine-CoA ligase
MRAQSEIEQLIRRRVGDHPATTWLYFKDREYSWVEVLSHAQRAANGLLELGLRPGDRVAIMAGNRPEFLWAYFGALMIGCPVVPLNKWQRGAALKHMFNDCAARAVVIDPDLAPVIAELGELPFLKWRVAIVGPRIAGIDAALADLMLAADREPRVAVENAVGAVGILYTSGTTGAPKGILAHNYEPFLKPLIEACGVGPGEVMMTCMPLFHGSGLLVFGTGSIRLDAKLALAEGFSASNFWADCRRYNAVASNLFGVMIPYLMKQLERPDDRDNPLRVALSLGCPATEWSDFEHRFDVVIREFYGATDASGFLLNTDRRVGSVGKPVDGAEFRIVDDDGRDLSPGMAGEIVYRHPIAGEQSYNNQPDVSARTWRGGWYHSGDLGVKDAEGFFYFRGRTKEAIRRRGENISAWEVSSVVDLHPKVQESAAFGVPSELGEEEVMVAIVQRPGETIAPAEILDFCQGRLAYYAMPRYVDIVAELPKTSTQKVQLLELKARGKSASTWDRESAGYVVRRG